MYYYDNNSLKMEINFKYNIGDIVTLASIPPYNNLIRHYLPNFEFKPKDYKIEKCKYVVKPNNKSEVLYNLYAYCDDTLEYNNWIPESCLDGTVNKHMENVDFISHDKEVLYIGDDVLCSVFYGDYESPYLPPDLTFSYFGTIIGLEFVMERGLNKKLVIVEGGYPRYTKDSIHIEFAPYIVKNIDENFVREYVKWCKKNRFNPITESDANSYHDKLLKNAKIWDKVTDMYSNWSKIKNKEQSKEKEKKTENKETTKSKIENILKSLSEDELKELKNQLKNGNT